MAEATKDTFGTRTRWTVGGRSWTVHALAPLAAHGFDVARLPFGVKVLLENLLRREDGESVTADDVAALAGWDPEDRSPASRREISFMPARVLLQDFTGVPAVVDLAAMRDRMAEMGGDPRRIVPLQPAELVIDHSVQVDAFGSPEAFASNAEREFARNHERYLLLRWGQEAFDGLRVVPPATGIVHQVNLERLARVVFDAERGGERWAWPDTLIGTDSHTTMVNALGVLGWGVGGIEAEAALLGQPLGMLVPQVVGLRLEGTLPEGATATDLVLTVTQRLRSHGVVGRFVEFFGPGLAGLALPDRATIANMAPEYGATCGIFPIDDETLAYLRFTGRSEAHVALVEAYARRQGLFHDAAAPEPRYTEVLRLDLSTVEPSLAGPRRPQDRVALSEAKASWEAALEQMLAARPSRGPGARAVGRLVSEGGRALPADAPAAQPSHAAPEAVAVAEVDEGRVRLRHGSVVIAAITSCTNTSNPSVMLAAGLLARNATLRGLTSKPWVKTSLAPGSKVVTQYLARAGLLGPLEALGFHLVGYGCTTCIGNSGPLPEEVSRAIRQEDLVVASVLSGNRNFEGRIHPEIRANYLASPPLVVAYAIAGRMDVDLTREPLGTDADGRAVRLADVWPSTQEVREAVRAAMAPEMFAEAYEDVFAGDERWQALPVPEGERFAWQEDSTYVRRPPFLEGLPLEPEPPHDVRGARLLALLGDSVTTDHISPAGSIGKDTPAGRYLLAQGVLPADFNSYGARRGNHEVMVRGTFANVRLRNQLAPGTEGGFTRHLPGGAVMTIHEAALRYREEGVPLLVIAGREYGTGSSRDWAAKGTRLLGVRAVLAASYERIHRSNLIGMGVLPLEFPEGEEAASLGLDGTEVYDIVGLDRLEPGGGVRVRARSDDGSERSFEARVRIDTRLELVTWRHGGILPYVLRKLLGAGGSAAGAQG